MYTIPLLNGALNAKMDRLSFEQFLDLMDKEDGFYRDDNLWEMVTYYYEPLLETGIGVEVSADAECVDIFRSFGYTDFSKYEREQNAYTEEEIAGDECEYLQERYFALFLRNKGVHYVCTWDDGAYMCRGRTNRIGYRNLPYCKNTVSIVEEFLNLCEEFDRLTERAKGLTILNRLAADYVKRQGYPGRLPVELETGKIELYRESLKVDETFLLQSLYIGQEYALFSEREQVIWASAADLQVFLGLVKCCEYYGDVDYFLIGSHLIGVSRYFIWIGSYGRCLPDHYSMRYEQGRIIEQIRSFLPYADSILRDLYFKEYQERLGHGSDVCIFTEGPTDWKHLKFHLNRLEKRFTRGPNIRFHEYEPTDSPVEAAHKMDMGGNLLCDMCFSFSKKENEEIYIFIADRDRDDVVKKLSPKDTDQPFRAWGNHVYSIVLPIPEHRISTPRICIEHYYSDAEIKAEFMCADGIKRRLYIGNEFDQYGRAINLDRFCVNREACGSDSVRIISGSGKKERVISLTKDDGTNYALSKALFVEHVCNNELQISRDTEKAFEKLFEVIRKIKQYDEQLKTQERAETQN